MNATVFLARHASHAEVGRRLSGRSEIALSDHGRREAARLRDRLQHIRLARILSSPRKRAQETAQIVADQQGLEVERSDMLDEIDFGAWAGRSFEDLEADPAWNAWNDTRALAATPAGETMTAATARAVDLIEAVKENSPVLCVSHCDIIRGIAAHYLNLSFDRLLAFDCDPASLTILAFDSGTGRVATLNERPA